MGRTKAIPGASFVKETVAGRWHYWRARVGKKLTGDKPIRRRFSTYGDAVQWVNGLIEERKKHGTEVFSLNHSQLSEARAAFQRLAEYDTTLTAVVDHWIKFQAPLTVERSLSELEKEFLASRQNLGCKEKTLAQYRSYLKVICEEFGETKVARITQAEIEDWLAESEWAARTRKNYLVTLVTFFEWARARGYAVLNPAERIPKPLLDDRPPGILSPKQAVKLLKCSKENDPELIPSIAIQLFAGLRRSEVGALDWSEIDLAEKHLEVKAAKAKTRQRRLITIQPALADFLDEKHVKTGPLWQWSVDNYSERLANLAEKAEVNPWPHNALRHSFGSYYYALTRNENHTAAEMGNSPQMVFAHYRALVKPVECTAYWSIRRASLDL
jgi:integrase